MLICITAIRHESIIKYKVQAAPYPRIPDEKMFQSEAIFLRKTHIHNQRTMLDNEWKRLIAWRQTELPLLVYCADVHSGV